MVVLVVDITIIHPQWPISTACVITIHLSIMAQEQTIGHFQDQLTVQQELQDKLTEMQELNSALKADNIDLNDQFDAQLNSQQEHYAKLLVERDQKLRLQSMYFTQDEQQAAREKALALIQRDIIVAKDEALAKREIELEAARNLDPREVNRYMQRFG